MIQLLQIMAKNIISEEENFIKRYGGKGGI